MDQFILILSIPIEYRSRLGQRVIPVEMPNARSSKRIVLEDVRMAMEAPPMIAPRPVTEDRLRFGCSTAQAAPVNDFR